jgi:drug/metabolite transporter (DMT)-like permease
MVAMVVIWGYSWVVMKIALRYARPLDFATLRVGIGCALLFVIVAARGRGFALARYRMAVLLGLLQVALFVALTQFALWFAGPGRTSVLTFTMPFWMIVLAHFILRERMRGPQWLAVVLGFAGLVLIVEPWSLTNLAGSLLAVAAGAVWATAAVLSKRWPTDSADPLLFTAWQLLFGFVALLVLAALNPPHPVQWNATFIASLLFSSVLATAIAWWLWTYVLAHTPAGITGLNSLGIPVIAVIASAIQLGERPPAIELAGMVMIGVALALLAALGINWGRTPFRDVTAARAKQPRP